jgi:hypothetical protein
MERAHNDRNANRNSSIRWRSLDPGNSQRLLIEPITINLVQLYPDIHWPVTPLGCPKSEKSEASLSHI